MNRVFVSGLGNASDIGLCEACELNFSWIVNYPSVLIWCDEICLPKNALKAQKETKADKSDLFINLFLDLADNEKIIREIDLSPLREAGIDNVISNMVEKDSESLLNYDSTVSRGNKNVPGEIVINGHGYCYPVQSSIYTSILSASLLNASCLFNKYEKDYLDKLYTVRNYMQPKLNHAAVFDEVFSLYLPENLDLHNYAFIKEDICKKCKHYDNCKSTYLFKAEKSIKKVLEWRNYDEIQRAKEELDQIIKQKNNITDSKSLEEIRRSYEARQEHINKKIRRVFPKIERWTKLATFIATPLIIATAAFSENIPLAIAGAAIPELAKSVEAGVDYYKSRHNWVGFINNQLK